MHVCGLGEGKKAHTLVPNNKSHNTIHPHKILHNILAEVFFSLIKWAPMCKNHFFLAEAAGSKQIE